MIYSTTGITKFLSKTFLEECAQKKNTAMQMKKLQKALKNGSEPQRQLMFRNIHAANTSRDPSRMHGTMVRIDRDPVNLGCDDDSRTLASYGPQFDDN